jgi:hypothetical protein
MPSTVKAAIRVCFFVQTTGEKSKRNGQEEETFSENPPMKIGKFLGE